MEHLALEIFDLATNDNPKPSTSKYAMLDEEQSITITDTSEIFASGDVWSHSFTLNVYANAHIFGTSGEIHGSRIHEQINKRRARLWVEGLPLFLGYLKLDDEAEVDDEGNVDVSFESGQKTFDDLIEGAKANQVPLMNNVLIGMALWRKRWARIRLKLDVSPILKDRKVKVTASGRVYKDAEDSSGLGQDSLQFTSEGENDTTPVQEYPRMVFPKGEFVDATTNDAEPINRLNTDYPYTEDDNGTPTYPYCNVALCYQKYGYEKEQPNGSMAPDYSQEPEAERGYEYMPANRVNSAPNFYVIYWLRCLMKHLGIHIEENQMMDVEDLRRLFFVNTKCDYKVPKKLRTSGGDDPYGKFTFKYTSVGLGGHLTHRTYERLIPEQFVPVDNYRYQGPKGLVKTDETKFSTEGAYTIEGPYGEEMPSGGAFNPDVIPEIDHLVFSVKNVDDWGERDKELYEENNCYLHYAYATSECFPDVDVSEVISAIENGFGVRFLFSENFQRVRIVLMRNLFKSSDVQEVKCDIISESKQENSIRGFRMTYGNSEDTHFYYKGFADKLPHKKQLWPDTSDKHDYSQWDLDAEYEDVINKVTAFNKTCYVTPENGNAYIVKVDKDAKRYKDLHPSLFEGAGFMDAEDGDCTGEEDTIEEINIGFTPAIMNDLNMETERTATTEEERKQKFALFVEEKMRPRRPDLEDGQGYNTPDAYYDVNGKLYAKDEYGYKYKDMMYGGTVRPGEFAITSDTLSSYHNLKARISGVVAIPTISPDPAISSYEAYNVYWDILNMNISGHINEGYRLYLQDNYEPNDDGVSPVETHDWGLTLGIMRGSGSDAYVNYETDPDDGDNETWDIVPGNSATAHADTCDNYGHEWDYTGSTHISTPSDAINQLAAEFPDSNAPFKTALLGYVDGALMPIVTDDNGEQHGVLMANSYSLMSGHLFRNIKEAQRYADSLSGHSIQDILNLDREGLEGYQARNVIIEIDTSYGRRNTMLKLCRIAYGGSDEFITIDNGVGSMFGRFSLKLRAEKPNPYFDPTLPESPANSRYLEIDNENLKGRGLADQFYKEYSYWVRNARIVKRTVYMELAQLLAIDKTKKVSVGDVTGFIRKMQYNVSNKTGLGEVTMEIMYI